MKKFLLSLILVTPLVCESVYDSFVAALRRCENDEVVCYVYAGYSMQCQFKVQADDNSYFTREN